LECLEERNLLTSGLVVVPSPFINDSTLGAVTAIADNDIWAIGASAVNTPSQATLVEHFNGSSWSVVTTAAVKGGGSLGSVSGVAGNDVWAVGDQTANNSTAPLIEHWSGTSWSVVASAKLPKGSFLTAVAAVASNDVWAVGDQPGSDIFSSFIEHWNGTSWSVVSSPQFMGESELNGVSADSANDVWAVGRANSAGLVEHWNGQTWSVVPSPSITGNPNNSGTGGLNAVTALSPTNVWAVGTRPGPPPADIEAAIEHWNGTSWSFVAPASSAGLGFDIAAVSANNVWAIIGGGAQQWNGTSWSQIANPSGVNELEGVTALSDGTVVAVGMGTNNSAVIVSNNPPSSALASIATPQRVNSLSGFADVPASSVAPMTAAGTKTVPAPLDPTPVDQFFATAGMIDQPLTTGGLQTMPASMMMQPANGMSQLADAVLMEAGIDGFFQMLDARLLSLESSIVARMPQLDGMIQSFNAMVTGVESAIAGHPIDDLSGKV
jgi:hypothetical protein